MPSLLDFLGAGGNQSGLLGNLGGTPPNIPAPAAPQQSFGNILNNNAALLMALGGGIAQHGVGGFSDAANMLAAQNQQKFQQLQILENIRHQRATEQQAATTPVKVGQDSWGGDIMAVRDPNAPGGFRQITVPAGTAQPTTPGTVATGKTGEDFLNTLPADRRALIEKLANYDVDPRTLSIKGGHRERSLAEAAQANPAYDQRNYVASQEGLKKFQSGPQGNAVRSFNVALDHLDQLGTLGNALQNRDIQKINEIRNYWRTQTGSEVPTNFEGLKAIVGQEVVKAIVANGGGEGERQEAARRLSAASSPSQLNGIIETYKGAMAAQLQGLKQQYEQSTLRNDFPRLLSDKAKSALEKHIGQPGGVPASATAPVAAPPTVIPPLEQRKKDQLYNTPKGPMYWRGNGWEPVSNANST